MSAPPGGIIGKLSVERPVLANFLIAIGFVALALAGVRAGGLDVSSLILNIVLAGIVVVLLPLSYLTLFPISNWRNGVFAITLLAGIATVSFVEIDVISNAALILPRDWILAGAGLGVLIAALYPAVRGILRLSVLAALTSIAAAAAASGFVGLNALALSEHTHLLVAIAALTMTIGYGVGAGVAADFIKYFTNGATWRAAAVSAGHGGVAVSTFAIVMTAVTIAILSYHTNYQSIDWRFVWVGVTGTSLAVIGGLFSVSGGLALSTPSESVAEIENRKRRRFRYGWRPFRMALPPASALGSVLIVLVLAILLVVEAGIPYAVIHAIFLALVWISALVIFVSVRAATFIALLLASAGVMSDGLFVMLDTPVDALEVRFIGFGFAAIFLSQLTLSWREARDNWHSARDVAENALSDGAGRFALNTGVGIAVIYLVADVLAWSSGMDLVCYLAAMSFFSIALAPAFMTTLSMGES